jgi:hypothetical protein
MARDLADMNTEVDEIERTLVVVGKLSLGVTGFPPDGAFTQEPVGQVAIALALRR